MASTTIPIREKVRNDSYLTTSLNHSSAVPPPLRKLLKLSLYIRLLRNINSSLSGEALGDLTREEASDLYELTHRVYVDLRQELERLSQRPWIERKLISWWTKRVETEVENLGDIVETLAWGSDDHLRDFVQSAIDAIEHQHVT
jgi:hypothetical protein